MGNINRSGNRNQGEILAQLAKFRVRRDQTYPSRTTIIAGFLPVGFLQNHALSAIKMIKVRGVDF
jgi:hypothetical protein